jgi:hypothetical protein
MGKFHETFNSNQTKAKDFIKEVRGYLRLNADINRFNSLMKKIAFTLTHMKGEDVVGWTRDIGTMLDGLNPINDNIPMLWDQFLMEFEAQYLGTAREDRACTSLQNLRMKLGEVDMYISKFEELAHKAGYIAGNTEMI